MKTYTMLAVLVLALTLVAVAPLLPVGAAGPAQAALPQRDLTAAPADAPLEEQAHLRLSGVTGPTDPDPQATMTRLRLYEGENDLNMSLLDAANGYAYFGTRSAPGAIIKVRLSDFTRVDTLVLPEDEDHVGTGVLDAANGYAYFGVNSALGSKIIQVRLSDFVRVADLPMEAGERWVTDGVIDAANGYAYFAIEHLTELNRIIKVRLSDFTRQDEMELWSGTPKETVFSAAIDTTNGYIYYGLNWNAVMRVRLSDFTRQETRDFWGYGASVYAAAVDPAGGYAYFSTFSNVLRFRLSDFTFVDNIDLGFDGAYTLALDAGNGYLYASHKDPALVYGDQIFKINLADFSIEDDLFLENAEKTVWTCLLDEGAGMLYLGTATDPGIIVKVDLATFTRVGALTLEAGSPYPWVSVIDTTNGYAYYGNYHTIPGRIYRVHLSDFTHTYTDTLTLAASGERNFWSAVIDVAGGYAYFGTDTEPGSIARIRLSDFTYDGTLTLATGENNLQAAAVDLDNGFAYFGTNTDPGRIVKVDLATFTRVGALTLPADAKWVQAGFADTANGLAYFATYSNQIVRIDLATFTFLDAIAIPVEDEWWYLAQPALFDPLNGCGYFNLRKNSADSYGRIVQVDLAAFTQTATLEFPGESDFGAGAIDPAGGYLYMSTREVPSHLLTVRLADASVVDTTVCPGDDTYRPMTAVIDPQAGYVYFGLHTPPTGSVIRMPLYQEGGTYRVYLPIVAKGYAYSGGLPIAEGFEGGVVPPAMWTRVQTNPRQTWDISTDPYAGTYSADVSKDWDEELQDEILLSSQFEASSAELRFYSKGNLAWCRDTYDNCDLNIWLVVGGWGGDDDIFLGQADDDWPAYGWGLTTIDLTPHLPAGTPVRVAFQYYGQDGAWIKIDQISITGSEE